MSYARDNNRKHYDEVVFRELKDKEIDDLLEQAQSGCDESRDALITGFYKTIEKIAKQTKRGNVKAKDLMADGFIAVSNCIEAYNQETANCSFKVYTTFAIKNEIKNSDLLFSEMRVPQEFKKFLRFYHKCVSELMDLIMGIPERQQIIDYMVSIDNSERSEDENKRYYHRKVSDYEINIYNAQRVYLDSEVNAYSDFEGSRETTQQEFISFYDEDPLILEVEDEIQISQIISIIKSGQKFPFSELSDINYDKLMIEIGKQFLDHDERLILYHSYGYLDHEQLKAKEINQKLRKPMTLSNLSEKKHRIIKKIKNFFE